MRCPQGCDRGSHSRQGGQTQDRPSINSDCDVEGAEELDSGLKRLMRDGESVAQGDDDWSLEELT